MADAFLLALVLPETSASVFRLKSQRKDVYKGSVQFGPDLDTLQNPTKQLNCKVDGAGCNPVDAVSCQAMKEQ